MGISKEPGFAVSVRFETVDDKGNFVVSMDIGEGDSESTKSIGISKIAEGGFQQTQNDPGGSAHIKARGTAYIKENGEVDLALKFDKSAESGMHMLNKINPQKFNFVSHDYRAKMFYNPVESIRPKK